MSGIEGANIKLYELKKSKIKRKRKKKKQHLFDLKSKTILRGFCVYYIFIQEAKKTCLILNKFIQNTLLMT